MTRSSHLLAVPVLLNALLATAALSVSPPPPNEFVLFAGQSLRARGLVVKSGDVGANVSVIGTKRIDAGNSTIAGDSVSLHPNSTCDELLANHGQSSGGCGPAVPVTNPIIANVAAACGAPSPFPACNSSARVFVAHNQTTVLPPGTYGDVTVSGGGSGPGTLILAGGTYNFCSLLVARNGQVDVRAASTINVTGNVKLDNGSNLGPESSAVGPCDIQLFSNGSKVRLSRRAAMTGVICAPQSKLELTVGANLFGAAYAREVKSDRVFLELPGCRTGSSTTTTSTPTTSSRPTSSSTTTSTSTTTTTNPNCGNGVVDPGEPCDASSPTGAFDCPPGSTCSSQCTCLVPTTTSTTNTTTTTIQLCGNGMVDPGEPCDPSSPGGAFTCLPGESCSGVCTCVGATTTTSSTMTTLSTTTSTSSSTTTTTNPCGNGQVDPGEPCDPSSPGGAFDCPPGDTCTQQCTCAGVPTTSTTSPPTTSSTSTSTSTSVAPTTTAPPTTTTAVPTTTTAVPTTTTAVPTTTTAVPTTTTAVPTTTTAVPTTTTAIPTTTTAVPTTTTAVPTTTTTMPVGPATHFDFTATAGSGQCGSTFADLAGTVPLKKLLCGNLSLGGGASQVPDNTTPSGSTNRFGISCNGSNCTVSPVLTPGTGFDCTNTGCLFGTPLPISNAGLSVCVTNTFSQPVSGNLDTSTGAATLNFQLNSRTVLTSTPAQPCPRCSVSVGGAACVGSLASPCTGVCDGSGNQGSVCTTKNPNGLTSDCPSPDTVSGSKCFRGANSGMPCTGTGECPNGTCALFIGDIPISLNPLTTGTTTKSSAAGTFCTGQGANQKGAFKSDICVGGANSGKPCSFVAGGQDAANCGTGAGISCRNGTLSNYCATGTNAGKGCTIATDCGTGGTCVKAGTLVQLISATGSPGGALALNVPKAAKLASIFCVGVTTNGTVNANANLPGPGATVLAGNITLIP